MIAEPAVTLTDYALTLESSVLAWLLHRMQGPRGQLRRSFVVFYAALGVAGFAGGTTHGFFHDESTLAYTVVWDSALIAIGAAGLAAWFIATGLIRDGVGPHWTRKVTSILFLAYCVIVVGFSNTFLVAIVFYLPATLFLFFMFAKQYLRTRKGHFLWGGTGLVLTLVAAGVQQAEIGLHPRFFDHNALYHLIQAVALLFLFFTARGIIRHEEA